MRIAVPVALALVTAASASALQTGAQATYRVTFDLTWSAVTHPGNYPANAHMSPPIGATHRAAARLWEPGGLSSPGMERMAETGATNTLTSEINGLIGAGDADQVITRSGFDSPATRSMVITVSEDFPLVSLVTMVAPSPDWFVGVDSLPLNQGGLWRDDVVVPLVVWDAGTDSGADFTSPNQDTNPQEPIALQDGGPFLAGGPALGTLTFTRLRSTAVYGDFNPAGTLQVSGDPELGASLSLTLIDPLGVMASGSQTLLVVSPVRSAIFPSGRTLPGFGLASPSADGELLVGMPFERRFGPQYNGLPVTHTLDLPDDPAMAGTFLFAQGVFIDPGVKIGLTDAVEILIGN